MLNCRAQRIFQTLILRFLKFDYSLIFYLYDTFLKSVKQSKVHAGHQLACTASTASPQVVLTRERGKNGKLMKLLQQKGISVLEMPLVETAMGPDRSNLPDALREGDYDWVIVTSPESASVFLEGWREAGKPQVLLLCNEEHSAIS